MNASELSSWYPFTVSTKFPRHVERVVQREVRGFGFIHHAHAPLSPLVTDTHATQAEQGDVQTRGIAQLPVAAEGCRGGGRGGA